jgi:hypothetical protein
MRRLEYKEQLVDYFKKNLLKGYPVDSLIFALTNQGYSRVIVQQALDKANKDIAEKAPKINEKPVIKYSVYDENNNQVELQPLSFWDKVLGLFRK